MQSKLSGEEWKALKALPDDKTIVIKAVDIGSSVAVLDMSDYLQENSRQHQDKNTYKDLRFSKKYTYGFS